VLIAPSHALAFTAWINVEQRASSGSLRLCRKDQRVPPLPTGATSSATSLLRRVFEGPTFLLPLDFTLFLNGARTDAAIGLPR
jgi:hypothetical protein